MAGKQHQQDRPAGLIHGRKFTHEGLQFLPQRVGVHIHA